MLELQQCLTWLEGTKCWHAMHCVVTAQHPGIQNMLLRLCSASTVNNSRSFELQYWVCKPHTNYPVGWLCRAPFTVTGVAAIAAAVYGLVRMPETQAGSAVRGRTGRPTGKPAASPSR